MEAEAAIRNDEDDHGGQEGHEPHGVVFRLQAHAGDEADAHAATRQGSHKTHGKKYPEPFRQAQHGDGKIDAARAQERNPDQEAKSRGDHSCSSYSGEPVRPEFPDQDRSGVRADADEPHVAEVHVPGIAGKKVPALRGGHPEEDKKCERHGVGRGNIGQNG